MFKHAFCAMTTWLIPIAAFAADFEQAMMNNWHQFRGPTSTGVAPNADPPTEWSETRNIKWKVAIPGRGSGSPIVWGNRIFLLTAIRTDRSSDAVEASRALPRARLVSQNKSLTEGEVAPIYSIVQLEDRPRERGDVERRRGRGERGSGFGRSSRGGFGIEAPTNVYQFDILCIDRNTGGIVWQRTASEAVPHEGHHQTGSFASASPITDGQHVYAFFGSRGIYCYDLEGNLKWEKNLGQMRTRFSFGEGASPALFRDRVVIQWDHEDEDFIVALDARTGKEIWRTPRDEPSTWGTPLIVEAAGRVQVVTSGSNRIRSYDLADGSLIWECGGLGSNPIATPVAFEDLAIAMSGHNDPAGVAVPLSAQGDVTGSDEVAWQIDTITPYVSSPLLYDATLYFTKSRNAIISSVNARTGERIINQKRLPGMDSIYASPVGASGRIYFSSREGVTVVFEHGPELRILATNELGETIDASPAIVGNELIIRSENHLFSISEPQS